MDNLEENLYRENIRIAPLILRIGAYLIDILIILLVIAVMFSEEQKKELSDSMENVKKLYSGEYTQSSLDVNSDNSTVLKELGEQVRKSLDIATYYAMVLGALQIIYSFIFVYFYSATPGQIILRIKVVNQDSFDKPKLHECMLRAILKYILGTSFLISFTFAFIDRYARTIHDRVSKTIVICN